MSKAFQRLGTQNPENASIKGKKSSEFYLFKLEAFCFLFSSI